MFIINLIFISILGIRFYSLFISIQHEKYLIKRGAIQYGKKNSLLLSVTHIVFYIASIIESNINNTAFNGVSQIGLAILVFSIVMLFYVIYELKEIWTVKIYVLPDHQINHSFLFKYIKHPNYFLNIIPELVGLSLLCQSKYTAIIGIPIYLAILTVRIKQEERAMQHLFKS
ncbi:MULTISPECIES: isoprenylcysteine carboxyl methyltransferase family protein [Pasteurellaceae]|uniref:Isoprenylcysteine carboxyl methyltransferase family protein n=1 Tax=Pasteurella atlantica TaxID=2827233 RepID=A0AAW8CEI4_9PAST|nr:isoprenylcysteine carboxyl methyltransferase family protein [Pasteurella atlantica]MBR0573832.1 isoprenylcysteine carboxyl methyltransferase family protein [Pasteurella atlantica]MDP8039224.1 isoprenylcysteine carboxyl methyltransferase family protein [Pasteurella atlantica]MDP8041315.1 isoprenylcysteine carboxyl methyltransferase family protein [Pasteurella atlantica]MDP8043451.1 isoprenylcysteine carboxyl methyltransferase family protein [Pasteurella atlantica]MDP8045630.1 isoprenylcystei